MVVSVHLVPSTSPHVALCGYPSFGLPPVHGQLWKLRSAWLQNVMYILMDSDKYHWEFGNLAYPEVKAWFLQLMWGGTLPTAHGAFEEEHLSQTLLDPLPYLVMFRKFRC